MPRVRKPFEPFEIEITDLEPTGWSLGRLPGGREVRLRAAPPGARLWVQPVDRRLGGLIARRLHVIRPPADGVAARCPWFGACGGCTLQELTPEAQRQLRHEVAVRAVAPGAEVTVHPPVEASAPWGYRNRVELSYGPARYLSEEEQQGGVSREGRFLGFHASGWFDRIVDVERCDLVHDDLNALIHTLRAVTLPPEAPPPWDNRSHEGDLRYVQLRHAPSTGSILVSLYTRDSEALEPFVARLAEALFATPLTDNRLTGFEWVGGDGRADVARGQARRTWGTPWVEEHLGPLHLRLSRETFFQSSTAGARVLYDVIGAALGADPASREGTLLDLYCGAGTIGLYLAPRFERLLGVEIVERAVADAHANAERNGIEATFIASPMEDALHHLSVSERPLRVVVDPPRAGLHPKVTRALADLDADVLVYVSCQPASLGRDQALLAKGGWRMTDLWSVDMFPHTGHVEAVARFVRDPAR
jgi:23S rRNA (uracil1939-C5)-methyltransferase